MPPPNKTSPAHINQLIFCAAVLGLSISLAKGQETGSAPATTGYSGFSGAFGIIAASIGIVALFVESVNGIITWAADGLASLILLAGGIAMTIGLKGVDCGKPRSYYLNPLINCGTYDYGKDVGKGGSCLPRETNEKKVKDYYESRCRMARSDDVILFIGGSFNLAGV